MITVKFMVEMTDSVTGEVVNNQLGFTLPNSSTSKLEDFVTDIVAPLIPEHLISPTLHDLAVKMTEATAARLADEAQKRLDAETQARQQEQDDAAETSSDGATKQ